MYWKLIIIAIRRLFSIQRVCNNEKPNIKWSYPLPHKKNPTTSTTKQPSKTKPKTNHNKNRQDLLSRIVSVVCKFKCQNDFWSPQQPTRVLHASGCCTFRERKWPTCCFVVPFVLLFVLCVWMFLWLYDFIIYFVVHAMDTTPIVKTIQNNGMLYALRVFILLLFLCDEF